MMHIGVERCEATVDITVRANAFLHHMVRNIAGALIAVGVGSRAVEWIAELLETRDRRQGGDELAVPFVGEKALFSEPRVRLGASKRLVVCGREFCEIQIRHAAAPRDARVDSSPSRPMRSRMRATARAKSSNEPLGRPSTGSPSRRENPRSRTSRW